jgi:hypothetical protein
MAEVGGRYRPKSRITQGRPPDKYSSRDCRDVNLPTSCACLNEDQSSKPPGVPEHRVQWILLRAQVEEKIRPQSTACTGCVATDCAARPLSAAQTCCFATTRFASFRCFATRPLRGLGGARQSGPNIAHRRYYGFA